MSADLMHYYRVPLAEVVAGYYDWGDVADWVVHVPRGSRLAEWFGGWTAVTGEEESMWHANYLLRAQMAQTAGRRSAPAKIKPPESVRMKKARAERTKKRLQQLREFDTRKQING